MRVGTILLLILCAWRCHAADIGSDTAVARFTTQQSLDNGDRIAGFAAIEDGFELKGAFVTGTFDSLFPITGRLDLNGGTLVLDKNIRLDHVSDFAMLGNITGQAHLIDLSSSVTAISTLSDDLFHCRLFSMAEAAHGEAIKAVDWSWDSQYIAVATDVVSTTSALSIYQFDGSSLSLLLTHSLDASETIANEARWHPSKYLLAVARDTSSGDEVFTYSFVPGTPELIQLSSDEVGDKVLTAAWHPTGDYLAVGGASNTAEIIIYPVDENGVMDIASRFVKNLSGGSNVRNESLDWDSTGNYLGAGLNADPELQVFEFGTSPLSLTLNTSKTVGNVVEGLDWNPTYSWILSVGVAGAGDNIEVYEHDNIPGTVTKLIGDDLGAGSKTNDWHPDGDCLAVGRQKLSSIGKLRTYNFNKDTPTLLLSTDVDFSEAVNAIRWSPNGSYLAKGHNVNLEVYGLIRDHCSVFNNVHILMDGDVTLRNCCIYFTGNSSINGGGNELTLDPSCLVRVESDSQLRLANMTIKGVRSSTLKVPGVGNAGSLLFENVNMKLGNRFAINHGHFDVLGTLEVTGRDSLFIYTSDQISTIGAKSRLILDEEITFSYDAPAPNLLQFSDSSAKLILAGATLHATSTGLELTNGRMHIIDSSFLSSEILRTDVALIDNGIMFGSGVLAENFKVKVWPNVALNCISGSVKYNNVGSQHLKMVNNQSHLHFYTATTLWLYENIDIAPGFIEFADQSRIMRAAGKNITGSIMPRGSLVRGRFTP